MHMKPKFCMEFLNILRRVMILASSSGLKYCSDVFYNAVLSSFWRTEIVTDAQNTCISSSKHP